MTRGNKDLYGGEDFRKPTLKKGGIDYGSVWRQVEERYGGEQKTEAVKTEPTLTKLSDGYQRGVGFKKEKISQNKLQKKNTGLPMVSDTPAATQTPTQETGRKRMSGDPITPPRTSGEIQFERDELDKRYTALLQEADSWASLQGTPEQMSRWEQRGREKRQEANSLYPQLEALDRELELTAQAERKSQLAKEGYREPSLWDLTVNSFKQGYLGAEYGKESYKEMMGDRDTRKGEYEELLSGEDYRFVPTHWWERAVSGGSSLLGQQLSQGADPSTLALMGSFGGMAAAAGQAGPQALLPEEVVTVPAALGMGYAAGSAMNNVKMEAGNAYNELTSHGVSEDTARAIAGAVGGVNGALEAVQLSSLLNSFDILKKSGAAREGLSAVAGELTRRGINVLDNVTQETLQEGTTIAGTQLGTKLETGKWAYGADEVMKRLGDTALGSALAFGSLQMPGAMRDVAHGQNYVWLTGAEGQGPVQGYKETAAPGKTVKADTSKFDRGILTNLNQARVYFINYAKSHFPAEVTNVDTGKKIGISRTGLDKFLSGRIPFTKYASGFHIPELIETAYKVAEAPNAHLMQAESIPTYEYYDSPIDIEGKSYMAHIRVRNTIMGDKYYGHTVSEVDDIKIEPSARTSDSAQPIGQPVYAIDDSVDIISQKSGEVKEGANQTVLDSATVDSILGDQRTVDYLVRKGGLILKPGMTQNQKRQAVRDTVDRIIGKGSGK